MISDVNHEMDVGTTWLGIHPPVHPVIVPRYTVHERALYFKSTLMRRAVSYFVLNPLLDDIEGP